MAMSELKLIVDQAIEEMGGWNDQAIDRWSELSGVDVRAIDENTPFDIDVANRLLATFPQVLEELMRAPAPVPEEPTPEEVITDLSEMAQPLSEALGVTAVEKPTEEATVPEVDLETGLAEVAPMTESVPQPETSDTSSIEALIRELESLATKTEPALKEETPSEKTPEAPVAEKHEEAPLAPAPEKPEAVPTPTEEAPEEVPPGPAWEIPAPVAEELERATKIMEEMEAQEYNLSAIEKMVPGFQAACVIREGRVVAKHSRRDVDWVNLSQAIASVNRVFKLSLGIDQTRVDELILGIGNLFLLGFLLRDAQIIVIVKSDRLGAARAYVSAAIKHM